MNCKPDELARVFRVGHKSLNWMRDRFVTVRRTALVSVLAGAPLEMGWVLDEPLKSPVPCAGCGKFHEYPKLPDSWLQPIRPEGPLDSVDTDTPIEHKEPELV